MSDPYAPKDPMSTTNDAGMFLSVEGGQKRIDSNTMGGTYDDRRSLNTVSPGSGSTRSSTLLRTLGTRNLF
jgi:hypothetical protein